MDRYATDRSEKDSCEGFRVAGHISPRPEPGTEVAWRDGNGESKGLSSHASQGGVFADIKGKEPDPDDFENACLGRKALDGLPLGLKHTAAFGSGSVFHAGAVRPRFSGVRHLLE